MLSHMLTVVGRTTCYNGDQSPGHRIIMKSWTYLYWEHEIKQWSDLVPPQERPEIDYEACTTCVVNKNKLYFYVHAHSIVTQFLIRLPFNAQLQTNSIFLKKFPITWSEKDISMESYQQTGNIKHKVAFGSALEYLPVLIIWPETMQDSGVHRAPTPTALVHCVHQEHHQKTFQLTTSNCS